MSDTLIEGLAEGSVEEVVEELMGCSDSGLDERVRTLELVRRRVEAELALTAGEIDRRRSYLDDGHRTIKAYLRATCNYSDAEAARVGRLTTAAGHVPGLADALRRGSIGVPQANELAVAYANPRVRDRLGEFAPMLLDLAERLSFREFRTCVQRFVLLADADGAHDDVEESVRNRRARVTNLNGSLHLDGGGGDALVNVELEAIFRYFCELEYEADLAARRAEFGDQAEEHPLARTAAQRGYDALVAIMRHALANQQAGRPGSAIEPLVNILVDHRTWALLLARAGLAPDTTLAGEAVDPFTGLASPGDLLAELLDDPDSFASRRCETSTGQVVHPHAVLRAALAGHIRRVVLGADSLPINLGRKARVFTGTARQAALLLAVQCDHLGCGLPAELCQVDHSVEFHEGGRTDQINAGVECGGHNREKHRKRRRTKRDIHGRIHTIRADGTIMLPVGVRPPVFPDDADDSGDPDDASADGPSAAATPTTITIPAAVARTIDDWANDTDDDIERRCRALRRTALRHAVSAGAVDTDALSDHLRPPAQAS
jgi:hypothetical protein